MVVSKVISANLRPMAWLGDEFPCLATSIVPLLLDDPCFPILLAVAPGAFIELGGAYVSSTSREKRPSTGNRRHTRYDYCDVATRFTTCGVYVKLVGTVYVSFKAGDNDNLSLGFLRNGWYTRENEADNERLADLVRNYQRGDEEKYNHGFSAEITRGFSTLDPGRVVSRAMSLSFPTLIQWSTGADYSPCSILEYALNKESSLYLAFGDTTNGDHSPGYLYSLNSLLKRNGLGSRRYPWSEASTASYYTVDRPITVCFKSTKGKNDHLFEDGTA